MTAPAQASTRDALLSLLLERGDAAAADMAQALDLSVQAIRRHLRSLAEEGLAESSTAVSGPGRPSNLWRITERGRERFPDGSRRFALGLLESMRAILPEETLKQLLNQQAEEKAEQYRRQLGDGSLQQRLEQLTHLRRDEGYFTSCSPEDDGCSWLLQEVHC